MLIIGMLIGAASAIAVQLLWKKYKISAVLSKDIAYLEAKAAALKKVI